MATIQVTSDNPLVVTITLTDKERKAVVAAAQEAARMTPRVDTPRDYFVGQIRGVIQAMVQRHDERSSNDMLQRFNSATPEQQAAALAAIGLTP